MKNKLLHHIRFDNTNSEAPESLTTHVVVVIMYDGVLFGGLNDDGEVTLMRYGKPKEGVKYAELEFIKHELINEPLLALPGKVSVFIADKRTMPVPLEHDMPLEPWLHHIHYLLPEEEVAYYDLPKQQIRLEYAIDSRLVEMIQTYLPEAQLYPFGLLLLPPLGNDHATIALTADRFWISVFKSGLLKSWHIEVYSSGEEIAYSLLHALKENGMPNMLDVACLSCFSERLPLFETVQGFLPHADIGTVQERNLYEQWLTVVKLLQRAALCVS